MFTLITKIREIVDVKRPVKLGKITNYKSTIINGDNNKTLTQPFAYVRSKYTWFFDVTAFSGP